MYDAIVKHITLRVVRQDSICVSASHGRKWSMSEKHNPQVTSPTLEMMRGEHILRLSRTAMMNIKREFKILIPDKLLLKVLKIMFFK